MCLFHLHFFFAITVHLPGCGDLLALLDSLFQVSLYLLSESSCLKCCFGVRRRQKKIPASVNHTESSAGTPTTAASFQTPGEPPGTNRTACKRQVDTWHPGGSGKEIFSNWTQENRYLRPSASICIHAEKYLWQN